MSRTKLLQDNGYKRYLLREMKPWLVTPDSITGRKKMEWEVFVSMKTIYNFIWLYNGWLRKLLTYKKRYRKRHSRQWKRPEWYKHINERPIEAGERSEIWHTEIDLVLSKKRKWGIMTLIDRKSRFWLISKVRTKGAKEINKVLWKMIRKEWIQKKLKTITSDNGHEFFWLRHIEKRYWFEQYYADPYSSRQRWTNEQYNWQIRKIFPKWTDFSKICIKTIQEIQTKLNRKPRKILWYKTPEEIFYST
jgi:IS30 family transposase